MTTSAKTGQHGEAHGRHSAGSEQGVIHDIGYRHYKGRRLGRGYVARSLLVDSLRGTYGLGRSARSKVMPMLLGALMCLPALVMVIVVNATGADRLPLAYTDYAFRLQTVVAIFVAAQAPQSVSRDLRFHTMPLYLSRPPHRIDYVLAKYAAMSSALLILLAVPLLIMYAGALLAHLPTWDQTRGLLQGLAGAVLFALVLTGIGLLIAALTPRRGLGIAAIITVLLVATAVGGVTNGIAQDQGAHTLAGYAGLIGPFTLVDGVQTWLFGTVPNVPPGPPGTLGGPVFALVAAVIVLGSFGLLLLRYRKVSVS
jgi:ABC-2 type transport system permease protein